jgi:hypothetical protein
MKKDVYQDTKYFSASQKNRAFNCFTRVLKTRDINTMDKNLYEYLHLNCGFIAHYNIHRFKTEYDGHEFCRFIEHFDRNSQIFHSCSHWVTREGFADVNNDMVALATSMAPQIYAEMATASSKVPWM